MTPLRLERAALDAMLAHARESEPEECCGAVIHADGHDRVMRFTNVLSRLHAEDPATYPRDGRTGYSPEPKELFLAEKAGREPGARLAVFYHSHPLHAVGGAYFSAEDQARAMFDGEPLYPDVTYVVVSDARVPNEAKAFHWDAGAGAYVEIPIELA